jgi:NitT/TauT family transport system substrate-binding protein
LAKNDKLKVKISLDTEWQAIYGEGVSMPMSTTIVRKDYLEKNPKAVEEMLEAYKASVEYVNSDTEAAAKLMVEHGIIGAAPIAVKAIPRCQITYISGQEAKDLLTQYYEVLFASNPKSIGGQMPGNDMYYIP